MLKNQPNLLQLAIDTILRQSELYGIKVKALDFLIRVSEHLLNQEEIGGEQKDNSVISIQTLADTVKRSGLISRCKGFFVGKDIPLLFVASLLEFLKKIIVADYKNTLAILTQIDFWTLLCDYIKPEEITKCDINEKRIFLTGTTHKISSPTDLKTKHVCLTFIFEFVIECLFREKQLANHLLNSGKLLQNILILISTSIKEFNEMQIDSRKLLSNYINLYLNRAFTLLTLFADNEPAQTIKNLFEELLKNDRESKLSCIMLLEAYNLIDNIDSAASICRFIAKLVEHLRSEEEKYFENVVCNEKGDFLVGKLYEKMGETYLSLKNEEEEVMVYTQQKYDIIKCISLFVGKSQGAKEQCFKGKIVKQIAKDLVHFNSVIYARMIEGKQETGKLVKARKTVMVTTTTKEKAFVDRNEMQNIGYAREMIILLVQLLKNLFFESGELIGTYKGISYFIIMFVDRTNDILNSLLVVYNQGALIDEGVMDELLSTLITLAGQGNKGKELFLHKDARLSLIECILKLALTLEINAEPEKIAKVFCLIQSLSLGKENANFIWKYKFLDGITKKVYPLLKLPQKELASSYPYLIAFTKFLAVYAYSEEGRKFLSVSIICIIP